MNGVDYPVSAFLLAENRLLREALVRMLKKKRDIKVVGAEGFSPLAMDQIRAAGPSVLLMDSFTPAMSSLSFLRDVQHAMPDLKVLMIGMEPNEQTFLQAVREGALGYVLREASAVEVVAAIRGVAEGLAICPPHLCLGLFRYIARLCNQMPNLQIRSNLGLTSREQQLVALMAQGLTNKEIASQLHLSEQTVRNHVHHILQKAGVGGRHEVVHLCRMQGLPV
jgi:DNA-binding NarL/FixJ family response regulator